MKRGAAWRTEVLLILAGALAACVGTPSTAPDPEFAELVKKTYAFHPADLSDAEKKEKFAALDQLWDRVDQDQARYLPALRYELEQPTEFTFFDLDGSRLLLHLSNEPADRARALAALERVEMADLQPRLYFELVHGLAVAGLDTSAAAFKILANPRFTVFLPDHFLTLPQDMCLLYMLLPAPEECVVPKIVTRFAELGDEDDVARRSLLTVAWYAVTREGDAFLRRVAADENQTRAVHSHAALLVNEIDGLKNFDVARLNDLEEVPRDVASARKLRMEALRGMGDETLSNVDVLTAYLRSKGAPGGVRR
jgi:hypothetical protein